MIKLACTLEEILELGLEAHHIAADGTCWSFYGCYALRADPVTGRPTLITDARELPEGPWEPTEWDEEGRRG